MKLPSEHFLKGQRLFMKVPGLKLLFLRYSGFLLRITGQILSKKAIGQAGCPREEVQFSRRGEVVVQLQVR